MIIGQLSISIFVLLISVNSINASDAAHSQVISVAEPDLVTLVHRALKPSSSKDHGGWEPQIKKADQSLKLSTQQKHVALQMVAIEIKRKQTADKKKKDEAEAAAVKADDEGSGEWEKADNALRQYGDLDRYRKHMANTRDAEVEVPLRMDDAKNAINDMQKKGQDLENLATTNRDMYVRVMHNAKPVSNIPSSVIHNYTPGYADIRGRVIQRAGFSSQQLFPWPHEATGVGHKTFTQLVDFVNPQKVKGSSTVPLGNSPDGSLKGAWRIHEQSKLSPEQRRVKSLSGGGMWKGHQGSSRWLEPDVAKVEWMGMVREDQNKSPKKSAGASLGAFIKGVLTSPQRSNRGSPRGGPTSPRGKSASKSIEGNARLPITDTATEDQKKTIREDQKKTTEESRKNLVKLLKKAAGKRQVKKVWRPRR